MSVFRNYDKRQSGGVNANALPQVYVHAWTPTQQNVRANPNIPSQPQRIQPHERGTFFPTSATGDGTLAPQMSTTGCSGCGCGGGADTPTPAPTASSQSTGHSFPGSSGKVEAQPIITAPRTMPRSVGAMRPTLPAKPTGKLSLAPGGGRAMFMSGRNSGR